MASVSELQSHGRDVMGRPRIHPPPPLRPRAIVRRVAVPCDSADLGPIPCWLRCFVRRRDWTYDDLLQVTLGLDGLAARSLGWNAAAALTSVLDRTGGPFAAAQGRPNDSPEPDQAIGVLGSGCPGRGCQGRGDEVGQLGKNSRRASSFWKPRTARLSAQLVQVAEPARGPDNDGGISGLCSVVPRTLLGREDSNLRLSDPESDALPLGHSPVTLQLSHRSRRPRDR